MQFTETENQHPSSYINEGRKEIFYLTTHLTHFILWTYGKGPFR